MRYSYEYKRKCIELYREGKWPETPDGKKPEDLHHMIRRWVRLEEANGPDVLKHKGQNKKWRAEERLELVSRVLVGTMPRPPWVRAFIFRDPGLWSGHSGRP